MEQRKLRLSDKDIATERLRSGGTANTKHQPTAIPAPTTSLDGRPAIRQDKQVVTTSKSALYDDPQVSQQAADELPVDPLEALSLIHI